MRKSCLLLLCKIFSSCSREHNFPRLGQMIIDFEHPFRKLSEEFTPHAQRIGIALNSLNMLYKRRNLGGEQVNALLFVVLFPSASTAFQKIDHLLRRLRYFTKLITKKG